jgi:diguanylate cyclase (GGDEF)-like protein/PAS domain S-box-containing protein
VRRAAKESFIPFGCLLLVAVGEVQIHALASPLRVWPSLAFVVCMLWRLPRSRIPVQFGAAFVAGVVARLWTDGAFVGALASQVVESGEILIALVLLRRLVPSRLDGRVIDFVTAFVIVGLAVPLAAAPIQAAIHRLSHGGGLFDWNLRLLVGQACGAALILPVVSSLSRAEVKRLFAGRAATETVLLVAFAAAIAWLSVAALHQPTVLAVVPPLLAAARLGRFAAAAVALGEISAMVVAAHLGLIAPVGPSSSRGVLLAPWVLVTALLPYGIAVLLDDLRRERERIAAREEHFREALHHSPFGTALVDNSGRCFSVNRAFCDFLGYSAGEMIGRRPIEMLFGDEREAVDARFAEIVAGERDGYSVEVPLRHHDGAFCWAAVAASAVRDEATGRSLYLVVQLQDIGARRATERALAESESRWEFALESAGQGVWDHDYAKGRTFYSSVWSRMLGYEPGELPTETDAWLSLVHPHDLPRVLQQEHLHLEGQTRQFECEFRMRHKDGRWIWILDRGKLIARDEAGRPLRMIGTHTDITENRQLTDALQQEKERLRITLQSIGDGVVCTDAHGCVTFVNPIAETLTGWSAAAAMGRPVSLVFRVVDESTDEPVGCIVADCLASLDRIAHDEGVVLVGRTGGRVDVKASASPVRRPNGELIGVVLVFQDVTRARILQRELHEMATRDALTGLLNRTSFERRLEAHCQTLDDGRCHTLLFLDLDRFKIINDTAGHAAGDALLREVGHRIVEQMRRSDVVARLGGDEFGVLLLDRTIGEAERCAEQLLERIGRTRFTWTGRIYEIGASIGLAPIEGEAPLAADVMSRADVACYAAKAAGRNRVSVYHAAEGDARRHHHELYTAAGIRAALENGRFAVFAQPIVDLRPAGGLFRHAELLVRMIDENGTVLSPGAFIPAAERYGLMGAIDRWMIQQVLRHYDRAIAAVPRFAVSINLSANSLEDPGLLAFLATELERSSLQPHRIHFEITETSLINNLTHAGRLVENLRAAGYAILLDDFGAGVSSFAYLERFPVDFLKIDGGFVRKLTSNGVDRAIVESINEIGHKLGAVTVAEFVEDADTLAALRDIGVDMAQGYHLGRPEPLDDLLIRLVGDDHAAAAAVA